MMNVPVPFQGTDAERAANRRTHHFDSNIDFDFRCWACDCKPWHKAADYPCGANVPRMWV